MHSSTILQTLHTHLSTIGRLDRQVRGCSATQTHISQPIRKFKNNTNIDGSMYFVSLYFKNRYISLSLSQLRERATILSYRYLTHFATYQSGTLYAQVV